MKNRKLTDRLVLVSIVLLISSVVVIFFPYNTLHGLTVLGFSLETQKYGELGDFISGVTTPILSASSILLLYSTYQTQKEELSEAKITLKQQQFTLKQQQFESTFFKLIDSYHLTINTFEYFPEINNIEKYIGKRFFEGLFKNELSDAKYKETLKNENTHYEELNESDRFYSWGNFYATTYIKNESTLYTWLGLLENIFKYVDSADLADDNERKKYISFITHQISPYEMVILACHVKFRVNENIALKNLSRKYRIFPSPNHIWVLTNNVLSEFYTGPFREETFQ